MPLVPLDLPAGFYRNGTDYEGSNRWREGVKLGGLMALCVLLEVGKLEKTVLLKIQ